MKKVRIFIVDDEEGIREPLSEFLEILGYSVETAPSPKFCQASAGQHPCTKNEACWDILLVDLNMPFMDGLTFLETRPMRGCKGQQAKTALITTHLSPRDELRLKAIGCDYLQKPIRFSDIVAWIDS